MYKNDVKGRRLESVNWNPDEPFDGENFKGRVHNNRSATPPRITEYSFHLVSTWIPGRLIMAIKNINSNSWYSYGNALVVDRHGREFVWELDCHGGKLIVAIKRVNGQLQRITS
jgi:hypothetical protein